MATKATWQGLAIRLAPLLFAAGAGHLLFQIWKHWDVVTLDFRFFWLAGDFWLNGGNPYDASYAAAAEAQFGIERGAIWYYPPNWFALAALLSLPDPLSASRLWLIVNAGLLLGGGALNVMAFRALRGAAGAQSLITKFLDALPASSLYFLFTGAVALSQAAGNSLHLGQSSILVYFGASLLLSGAARGRLVLAGAGLAILMLKPQIGALVCAGLIFTPFGRRTIAMAALASIAIAAPVFIATPPAEFLGAFAEGVARYTDQAYNMPPAVTGLRHLAWIFGAPDMGSLFYLLLALLLISAASLAAGLRRGELKTTDFIILSIAIAAAASPLHVYDLILLAALALPAISLPLPAGALALSALALSWRAGNLPFPESLSEGVTYYAGSFYASLSAGAIAAAVCASLIPAEAARARDVDRIRRSVAGA
ncbi:MAG: hypothetical protein A3E78_01825 [Alphaproteobacteria bacterium RIFCSPHIGHO2_12_FULL_63_12]|nr:MAG: hypothetical protein A3E78_01825 [Alphaproteobacteria bacterium RIFCSPHIGHO2_12_FULL_63_12]